MVYILYRCLTICFLQLFNVLLLIIIATNCNMDVIKCNLMPFIFLECWIFGYVMHHYIYIVITFCFMIGLLYTIFCHCNCAFLLTFV